MDSFAIATRARSVFRAMQDETELAELLDLLHDEVKPKTIVEIGCAFGGSLYAWSELPSVERVIGLTLPERKYDGRLKNHGAEIIYGDSTDLETQSKLVAALGDTIPDFFFIDGDHRTVYAKSDLIFACSVMDYQGLIGIHDINLYQYHPEDGAVQDLWSEVKTLFPTTEIANVVGEDPGIGLVWL